MAKLIKAAVVQAAPVPLAISHGIDRLVEQVRDAADTGARVVAFGETFLGGYPLWLDEAKSAAMWDHPGTRALHRLMLDNAVTEGDPRFEPLQALVDKADIVVSVGAHERRRNSLYNNQLTFRPGAAPLSHRKLVPTHGERLIWMRGDGSTLEPHRDAECGTVGSLICWEHWMPLARAAMHNRGETFHIAAWPTVRGSYAVASRHYAVEGRCYVLAAGTIQHRADLLDGLDRVGGDAEARALIEEMPDKALQFGGSMIVAPDTELLAEAGSQAEIITADCDLDKIAEDLASLDTDGHYSRPDVFELSVNTRPADGVVWKD